MSVRSLLQVLSFLIPLAAMSGCYDWDRCADGSYPEDHEGDDCDAPEKESDYTPPPGDFRGTVSNAEAFNGRTAFVSVWEIFGQDAFSVGCQTAVVTSGSVTLSWTDVMEPEAEWDAIWVLNADTNGTFSASGDDLLFYSDVRQPTGGDNVYDVDLATDAPIPPAYEQGWDGWQCW